MTWRDEIARRWPEYGEVIHDFGRLGPPSSEAPRTTGASPSMWFATKETESFLDFQKNLRLSLLREANENQDPTDRPPEEGDV